MLSADQVAFRPFARRYARRGASLPAGSGFLDRGALQLVKAARQGEEAPGSGFTSAAVAQRLRVDERRWRAASRTPGVGEVGGLHP